MSSIQREHLHSEPSPVGDPGWILMWYGIQPGADATSWQNALRPGELNVIFNLYGSAVVMGERTRINLVGSTIAMCWSDHHLTATRLSGESSHEYVVLSIQPSWLAKTLGKTVTGLFPALQEKLRSNTKTGKLVKKPVGYVRAMGAGERDMAAQLADPPCEESAKPLWYMAKVVEILSIHMFRPVEQVAAEPFCVSRKKINRDRIEAVNQWLDKHFEQTLELDLLAKSIGCARHYLSRFYSQETGTTISRKLRSIRIEKASQMMLEQGMNVTEAAVAVGYNSLSHFTKAFTEEKGVKPSKYLNKINSQTE